jgi:hypothetical protein
VNASFAEDVRALHDVSGLTWEQVGRMVGASRNMVAMWTADAPNVNVNVIYRARVRGALERFRALDLDRPGKLRLYDQIRGGLPRDGDISGLPANAQEQIRQYG